MTCKGLQHLLYSTRIEDLDPAERVFIKKHLADCETCKRIFQEVLKADRLLERIKEATPLIRNGNALTESIISAIISGKKSAAEAGTDNFLDRLSYIFSIKSVRFASSIVILLCGLTFVFMEYNDTKAIISLEQRLGKRSEFINADIFRQETKVLSFLRDLYNVSNGTASSVELTNTLVLVKKADLQVLVKGYNALDEASRAQLDATLDKYKKEESSTISSEKNREEITALQNEIEQLKNELEQRNHKEK